MPVCLKAVCLLCSFLLWTSWDRIFIKCKDVAQLTHINITTHQLKQNYARSFLVQIWHPDRLLTPRQGSTNDAKAKTPMRSPEFRITVMDFSWFFGGATSLQPEMSCGAAWPVFATAWNRLERFRMNCIIDTNGKAEFPGQWNQWNDRTFHVPTGIRYGHSIWSKRTILAADERKGGLSMGQWRALTPAHLQVVGQSQLKAVLAKCTS